MRLPAFAALSILGLCATPATAQPAGAPSLSALSGKCQSMIVTGKDLTPLCGAKVVNVAYPNGRTALWFALTNGGIFSFSSSRPQKIDRRGVASYTIDGVMFGAKPGADPAQALANGRCSYGDPSKGPIRIACEAKTNQGQMKAVFETDGSPPH